MLATEFEFEFERGSMSSRHHDHNTHPHGRALKHVASKVNLCAGAQQRSRLPDRKCPISSPQVQRAAGRPEEDGSGRRQGHGPGWAGARPRGGSMAEHGEGVRVSLLRSRSSGGDSVLIQGMQLMSPRQARTPLLSMCYDLRDLKQHELRSCTSTPL